METISAIIRTLLDFILQAIELVVNFTIAALNLILDFVRTIFALIT